MPNNTDHPLLGKKILFFAPAFFNYEKVIKDKMVEMGATVYLYDERSVKSALFRALNKVVPNWFNRHSHKYFHKIISHHSNESFDYIVVIKSDMMPISTLKEVKSVFKTAQLVLYLYDSIADIPGIKERIPYYDNVYTFDREDAQVYKLSFRPLFFSDAFTASDQPQDYCYDIAFLGTMHTDRFRVLKKIMRQANEYSWKAYWFLYLQASFMFYWYWLTKKEYKLSDKALFSTVKKSGREIAFIVAHTSTIIDIESPGQKGLTMRTIEMIGLKKKLITTNHDIINYDFYNPNNIEVVDRNNPIVSDSFIYSQYEELAHDIYQKYHISTWIMDILN